MYIRAFELNEFNLKMLANATTTDCLFFILQGEHVITNLDSILVKGLDTHESPHLACRG